MAKVNVIGNVMVITSKLKLKDLKDIKIYQPESLEFFNKDGIVDFRVDIAHPGGQDFITRYGVVFSNVTLDPDGYATCTVPLDIYTDQQDIKQMIVVDHGRTLMMLNNIEDRLLEILQQINEEKENIQGQITIGMTRCNCQDEACDS